MRPPDVRAPCGPRAAPAPCGRTTGSRVAIRGGPPDRRDGDTSPTRGARPQRLDGAGWPTRGSGRHRGHAAPARSVAAFRNWPRGWRSPVPPRQVDRSAVFFFRASQRTLETPWVHVETKASVNPWQQGSDAERRVLCARRRHKRHHRVVELVGAVRPAFPCRFSEGWDPSFSKPFPPELFPSPERAASVSYSPIESLALP